MISDYRVLMDVVILDIFYNNKKYFFNVFEKLPSILLVVVRKLMDQFLKTFFFIFSEIKRLAFELGTLNDQNIALV